MGQIRESIASADSLSRKKLEAEFKAKQKELYRISDIQMWKQFVPLISAPFLFLNLYSLREMCERPELGLQEGGIQWFHDLTVMDPYYTLPITFMVLFLLRVQVMNREDQSLESRAK